MRTPLRLPAGLALLFVTACGGGDGPVPAPGGPHAVTFQPPQALTLGLVPVVSLVLDANLDDIADLAIFGLSLAPGGASRVEVYLGVAGLGLVGPPSFAQALLPGPAVTLRPHAAVMDVEGDGDQDLIFTFVPEPSQSLNPVFALLSQGNGTFTGGTVLDPSTPLFFGPSEDAVPLQADLNDQDDLCVLFAPISTPGGSWRLGLFLRDIAGNFAPPAPVFTLPRQPAGLHAGDIDGDGRDDVMVEYASPPGYQLLLSNGSVLTPGPQIDFPPGDVSRGMAVGPIDAGPGLDVVSLALGGGPYALYYFAGFLVSPSQTDPNLFGEKAAPALGDLSGDGVTDLVFARRSGPIDSIYAYTGRGDLRFDVVGVIPINGALIGAGPLTIALGDVNGDGRLDLLHTDLGAAPGTYALRVSLQQ